MLGPALVAAGSVGKGEFVGVGSGLAPEYIVDALHRMLSNVSELLEFSRPDLVRIVVPCNTLSGVVVRTLEPQFSRQYCIETPDIVEHTVREAVNRGCERIRICGTDTALARYEQMATGFGVTFAGAFLPPGVKDFEELYTHALVSGTCWRCVPKEGEAIVSGCTDVHIEGAINSVDVFARDMAARAYDGEDL